MQGDFSRLDRREFLKGAAAGLGTAALGGAALGADATGRLAGTQPAVSDRELIWRSRVPTMDYRRLGRTNYMVSRIVQGFAGDEAFWRRLLAKGVNYWDTGWGYGDGNHERALGPFLKRFRDQLWITSKSTDIAGYSKIDEEVRRLYLKAMKAFLPAGDYDRVNGRYQDGKNKSDYQELLRFHDAAVARQQATGEKPDLRPIGKRMAEMYLAKLDESLQRMTIDHVDAYFMHGIEIPWFWDCTEVWAAYEKARQAGKVRHFGFSVHKHHQPVLAAAVEANARGPWKVDLCMPGVNPESFDQLRTELTALKKQDVGIVAMKTTGIKNRAVDGREARFKRLLAGKEYNEWERAKLWMLHLTDDVIDVCIAATPDTAKMERNLALPMLKLSADAQRELRALVKLEMAGACSLCGRCETNCPEHIAVTDLIRYHAYVRQYDEQELARRLYAQLGYDPAAACNSCGKCIEACPAGVPVAQILHQLAVMMA